MSAEYIEERSSTSEIVEVPDEDTDSPVVNSAPVADEAPNRDTFPHDVSVDTDAKTSVALINPADSERFRKNWNEVQGKFVDEPQAAVQQADALVGEVIAQLAAMFAHERNSLESQWKQGNDVSTEALRQAFLRYHSFFNRLVVSEPKS